MKKLIALSVLALLSTVVSTMGVANAQEYSCRMTLARSGNPQLSGRYDVIAMNGYVGERISDVDGPTRFLYKISVLRGKEVYCRGNRLQAVVSLYDRNEGRHVTTASTCFIPGEDFYVGSAASNHWLYFNCYSARGVR